MEKRQQAGFLRHRQEGTRYAEKFDRVIISNMTDNPVNASFTFNNQVLDRYAKFPENRVKSKTF